MPGLWNEKQPWQRTILAICQGWMERKRPWQTMILFVEPGSLYLVSKRRAATTVPSGALPQPHRAALHLNLAQRRTASNRAATVAPSGALHETAPPPSHRAAHHMKLRRPKRNHIVSLFLLRFCCAQRLLCHFFSTAHLVDGLLFFFIHRKRFLLIDVQVNDVFLFRRKFFQHD